MIPIIIKYFCAMGKLIFGKMGKTDIYNVLGFRFVWWDKNNIIMWNDVNNSKPKNNAVVLTYCPIAEECFKIVVSKFKHGDFWQVIDDGLCKPNYWNVTHWMELPKEPCSMANEA